MSQLRHHLQGRGLELLGGAALVMLVVLVQFGGSPPSSSALGGYQSSEALVDFLDRGENIYVVPINRNSLSLLRRGRWRGGC
jgi:hypothetical protein